MDVQTAIWATGDYLAPWMTVSELCTLVPSLILSNTNKRQSHITEAGSRVSSDTLGRKWPIVAVGKQLLGRSFWVFSPAQHDSLSSASRSWCWAYPASGSCLILCMDSQVPKEVLSLRLYRKLHKPEGKARRCTTGSQWEACVDSKEDLDCRARCWLHGGNARNRADLESRYGSVWDMTDWINRSLRGELVDWHRMVEMKAAALQEIC